MGNRVSCVKGKNDTSSSLTIAIIGPDNAGKTTLSSVLSGEPVDPQVAPTVGFRNVKFTIKKFDVTMYDLGGGKNIRPIWKNYFNEIYGIVYMVDSSCPERLKEARDLLRDTLEHPQVSGKPVLVLANKADVEGHMEEVDILNQLDLNQTVNSHNCPSHFVMISALQSSKAKMKKVVLGGFMWLLGTIRTSMDTLEPRVKEDMHAMKEIRDKEREERRERVRKQREEREKHEEKERARLGLAKDQESEEEEVKGDPFKPLDYNKLKLKEEKLKAEKKKRQELMAGKLGSRDRSDLQRIKDESRISYSMDDTMTLPRFGKTGPRFGRNADLDGLDINQSSALALSSRNARSSALPPLDLIGSRSLESKMNSMDKKKGKKKKSAVDHEMPENGLDSLRNGNSDIYGRPDFLLRGSRSLGPVKRYPDDNETDSLKLTRDDMLRRSDFSYKNSRAMDPDDDRELMRNVRDASSLGHLDFADRGSQFRTQADVHDLTPRVAKPRNSNVKTAGPIEEDDKEDSGNPYRNFRMSLKEYGDPRMSQKLDEYRDKYPLRSSSDTKGYKTSGQYGLHSSRDNRSKDGRRVDRMPDREDSAYRKSLRNISPPDMDHFDDDENEEEKDEGIEDDSESEDQRHYSRSVSKGKYDSYGREIRKDKNKNVRKDINANLRRKKDSEEDEEEDEYGSQSVLKDTLRFSRYDEDEDDSRRNYAKDINNLRHRRDNDYASSYRNRAIDSDEDEPHSRTMPDHLDQRRKKKKNILKSNKLMPSDDDEERSASVNQRYSSPRLVQERGSRHTADHDTPSRGRNSKTTYFHSGSSRDSDIGGQKWNLAEDLPTIDNDSRLRRNVRPRYDDSEDDVVY